VVAVVAVVVVVVVAVVVVVVGVVVVDVVDVVDVLVVVVAVVPMRGVIVKASSHSGYYRVAEVIAAKVQRKDLVHLRVPTDRTYLGYGIVRFQVLLHRENLHRWWY